MSITRSSIPRTKKLKKKKKKTLKKIRIKKKCEDQSTKKK